MNTDENTLKDIKNENSKSPKDFKVGEDDHQGLKIEHVYVTSSDYVVYRTISGIRVFTDEDHLPKDKMVLWNNFLKMGKLLGRVYSLQPENLSNVESINKTIARAISQSIEGNFEEAKELLKNAESRLTRLRCFQGRLEYLFSAAILACVFILILFIELLIGKVLAINDEVVVLSKVLICGSLGGFLSVSINVWKLDIDLDASRLLNSAAGGSRIIIASVAGIFAYFALKSGLIFSNLSNTEYGIYVASMAAGFSEKFIPNIIRSISKDDKDNGSKGIISCKS